MSELKVPVDANLERLKAIYRRPLSRRDSDKQVGECDFSVSN